MNVSLWNDFQYTPQSHIWNKGLQIHTSPDVTDEVRGVFFCWFDVHFKQRTSQCQRWFAMEILLFFHYSLLWKQNRVSSEWQVCFPVKIPTNSQPVMFCFSPSVWPSCSRMQRLYFSLSILRLVGSPVLYVYCLLKYRWLPNKQINDSVPVEVMGNILNQYPKDFRQLSQPRLIFRSLVYRAFVLFVEKR